MFCSRTNYMLPCRPHCVLESIRHQGDFSAWGIGNRVRDFTCRETYFTKGTLRDTHQTPRLLVRKANYTDYPTATGRRILVPTFADRGVSCGQSGGSPTAVNFSFLDRSRYFFFHVAPHLFSRGLSGQRSRPTATQKIL
jgi:hypothetical protein